MNLGQTMLSAATLVVLMLMVVNANRLIIEGEKDIVRGETYDIAVNYAQALLAEVSRKKFDANTKDSAYQAATEFTSPYSLGPNSTERNAVWGYHIHTVAGDTLLRWDLPPERRGKCPSPDKAPFKSIASLDDVDDYHGYQRVINTSMVEDLRLTVEVYYVSDTLPDKKVYSQTYFKRVVVYVSQSTYLNPVRPISFSTLVTN